MRPISISSPPLPTRLKLQLMGSRLHESASSAVTKVYAATVTESSSVMTSCETPTLAIAASNHLVARLPSTACIASSFSFNGTQPSHCAPRIVRSSPPSPYRRTSASATPSPLPPWYNSSKANLYVLLSGLVGGLGGAGGALGGSGG
eukprot:scaffold16183_cov89-Phaeocystis_antarctica.AAC.8